LRENLKKDETVIRVAFDKDQKTIKFAHKDVVLIILKENPLALEYVQEDLKKD
jgi:hypothetical protein